MKKAVASPQQEQTASIAQGLDTLSLEPGKVGARLRSVRRARRLTLAAVSERSGIALSTISKAERGDITLTYDKLAALAHALELDLSALFIRRAEATTLPIEPTFTPSGAQVIYDTQNYAYGMLATELSGKRMVPMRGRVHARKLEDFADYIRHAGEEFVFVLGGALQILFEDGRHFALKTGDSLYFDSAVGHVYLSRGKTDAEVLVCCVDAPGGRGPGAI
ncbi:cupin domain-containing protein [Chitinasiproducens palmae]|uniref:Cupin domain-containing protein n=1 Tax=Chitinasiproducens palmae TaxID=1770053 RepID=A0A1H2PK78_9BURK|nr:cupin domain-containing protein [Chitinasiproducens palmae]SDV46843.1 Cupin domain-containing protein [Chitinasiproducens palmae]